MSKKKELLPTQTTGPQMNATGKPLAVQIVIEQDVEGNSAIAVTYGEIRVDHVVKLLSKSIIDHIEMHDADIVPDEKVEITFDEVDFKMDISGALKGKKLGETAIISKQWADVREQMRSNYFENQGSKAEA